MNKLRIEFHKVPTHLEDAVSLPCTGLESQETAEMLCEP